MRNAGTYRAARRNEVLRRLGRVWRGYAARYVPTPRRSGKTYKPNGKREVARRGGGLAQ